MRTFQAATVVSILVALVATSQAQEVTGTYDVKFEEVANNCTTTGIALAPGKLRIRKEGKFIVVTIERIPPMSGSPSKSGAVRATTKIGPTTIEKLDGKFSVAGRADASILELVFVAEYYVKNKPLCTQSWNVTGTKESGETAKAEDKNTDKDAKDAPKAK